MSKLKYEDCPYFSKSMFLMRNHLRSPKQIFKCERNQLEMFHCRQCGFTTKVFMFLRKHLEEVHASDKRTISFIFRSYICESCSFQTYSLLHWLRHFTTNNCGHNLKDCDKTGNGFSCDQCPYKAKKKHHLKNHKIRKHTPDADINWFKCDKCSYKSKQKFDFKRHQTLKHSSEEEINWFKCDHCPFKSKHKGSLKSHKIQHTAEEDINWFECDQCPYKTMYKSDLKSHKISMHTLEEDINWAECDQCSYKSKLSRGLRAHKIRKHTSEEHWFKCDQCPYKSKYKHVFENHKIRKHTSGLLPPPSPRDKALVEIFETPPPSQDPYVINE